jgi:hypothetical protein
MFPPPIALLLRTKRDKTLLYQVEAVEIGIPLDYYPGSDSAAGANRGGADPRSVRTARMPADAAGKRSQ